MITQKQQEKLTANAVSGKTARACESCLKSRARWFCPADDAFLCHTCDSSVHSANELAARHNRVRLQTASSKPNHHHHHHVSPKSSSTPPPSDLPTWHQGFQKKARTPRNAKRAGPKSSAQTMMMPVVPEMSGGSDHDEGSLEESEEHMVFSVPTFDPFEDEGFNISLIGFQGEEEVNNNNNNKIVGLGLGLGLGLGVGGVGDDDHWDHFNLPEFDDLPPENDLAEFAADVESLLQQQEGTDEEAVPVLLEASTETDSKRPALLMPSEKGFFKHEVKVEDPEEEEDDEVMIGSNCEDQFDWAMDLENEVLNFEMSNNCGGKFEDEEEEEKKVMVMKRAIEEEGLVLGNDNEEISEGKSSSNKRRKIFLRLNYEEIINTWGGPSPWTTGCRPEFDADHDGWPNYMGGADPFESYFHGGVVRRNANGSDDGRQARVSRYREKRRKRLFSKKIRYEVRKLNAEKRPRLKGRFVKRTSSLGHGPTFPNYLNNK